MKIKTQKQKEELTQKVKDLVKPIRKIMPRYGTEKLYLDLKEDFKREQIKLGRDNFLKFCRENHMLVQKTKKSFITTDSNHDYDKPKNLIKDLTPTHAEQVFVSDITYIKLETGHAYLALVTDLYSKKIMGYNIDDNMKVSMVKLALSMAIKNRVHQTKEIIHHSDRGRQYCCPDYANFAKDNDFILSTTEQYDPYENAVAERINGILKYEFGLRRTIPNLEIATKMVDQAVRHYNGMRRHRSLEMVTPDQAHLLQKHKYASYGKTKIAA